METRNISLTLEKAKEWYNSGNEALREAALQAYTGEELKAIPFENIKTFKDAAKAIGADPQVLLDYIGKLKSSRNGKHIAAIYKLDIIRQALNGDWKPSLTKEDIYYPWIRFYLPNEIPANSRVIGEFRSEDQNYLLAGRCGACRSSDGLGHFYSRYGCGDSYANLGLLCCKSSEIAQHMSEYFGREIFDACYSQYFGLYEWL